MRILLQLQYDGSSFHGWQKQPSGLPTVEACLERALSHIAQEAVFLTCAGRTDTGVHAMAQYVHFDTQKERDRSAWVCGTNSLLPPSIRVREAFFVGEEVNARRSALWREYRYVWYISRVASPFFRAYTTRSPLEVDVEAMHAASQSLLGEHDFTSFRALGCQAKTAIRHIFSIDWAQKGPFIMVNIRANAFLHHMVRNIMGSLYWIGTGKRSVEWLKTVLEQKKRTEAGPTAPAQGLYLVGVHYPFLSERIPPITEEFFSHVMV